MDLLHSRYSIIFDIMKFEKTIYKKTTFEDADIQKEFWQSKSYQERLAAGILITKIAFGLVDKPEPKMDKTSFIIKSHRG